jgi:hypothetical protein
MVSAMNITIYALVDPRFPTLYRYIGQTEHPLRRHLQHCSCAAFRNPTNSRERWLAELRAGGIMPQFVSLEESEPREADSRELHWQKAQPDGQLTNDRFSGCRDRFTNPRPRRIGALAVARAEVDGARISTALLEAGWNMAKAARALGVSRPTLYERVSTLKLRRDRKAKPGHREWRQPPGYIPTDPARAY